MSAPALEHLRFSDGYEFALRWWKPETPRGAVLYLHGIQSHGGWYEGSGAALAERGFAVLMPDRRGSGLNSADRGHAPSAERLLADGDELIRELRRRTDAERIHLVGVSWGGKWGAALASKPEPQIATLSLIAPGIFARVDLPMHEKIRVGFSLLADPHKAYRLPLNDPDLFTANPERREFVERDDLKLLDATAGFLFASNRLDKLARKLPESGWCGSAHLMLAGQERIIDNARTRKFAESLAGSTVSEYPNAFHTLEFERDPQPFRRDLVNWIENHNQ